MGKKQKDPALQVFNDKIMAALKGNNAGPDIVKAVQEYSDSIRAKYQVKYPQ